MIQYDHSPELVEVRMGSSASEYPIAMGKCGLDAIVVLLSVAYLLLTAHGGLTALSPTLRYGDNILQWKGPLWSGSGVAVT